MEDDERLINQAHDLFNQHSIFEIIDIEDRSEAIQTMIEIHGPDVDLVKVGRYLDLLDRLRCLHSHHGEDFRSTLWNG